MKKDTRIRQAEDLFESFCELDYFADALDAAPEEFVRLGDFPSVEDALEEADYSREYAESLLDEAISL